MNHNCQEKWDYCLYVAWMNYQTIGSAQFNFCYWIGVDHNEENLNKIGVENNLKRFFTMTKNTRIKTPLFPGLTARVAFGSHFIQANARLMSLKLKLKTLSFSDFQNIICLYRWKLITSNVQKDLANTGNNLKINTKYTKVIKARSLSSPNKGVVN